MYDSLMPNLAETFKFCGNVDGYSVTISLFKGISLCATPCNVRHIFNVLVDSDHYRFNATLNTDGASNGIDFYFGKGRRCHDIGKSSNAPFDFLITFVVLRLNRLWCGHGSFSYKRFDTY